MNPYSTSFRIGLGMSIVSAFWAATTGDLLAYAVLASTIPLTLFVLPLLVVAYHEKYPTAPLRLLSAAVRVRLR